MPLITVKITYGPSVGNGTFETSMPYSGFAFDTDTQTIVAISGTWRGAMLDIRPTDYWAPNGAAIWVECAGFTATFYNYQRATNDCTTSVAADSPSCGFVPPETRTCTLALLSVSTVLDTATITCSNVVGPMEYSLDGGINRQSSATFTGLSAGPYRAEAFDLGATLPGCKASLDFVVVDLDPNAPGPALNALPEFVFCGNPIIVTATGARALADLQFQIWVENAHRSGQFHLAYQAKRRTDNQRRARLEVNDVLAGQLQAELNPTDGWHTLTRPIRNWFVRCAEVSPTSGATGKFRTSTNSVVLLGGLPAEVLADQADYFATALQKRVWMDWQPRLKRVGYAHREVLQVLQAGARPYFVKLALYTPAGVLYDTIAVSWPVPAAAPAAANAVIPPPLSRSQDVYLTQLVLDCEPLTEAGTVAVEISDGLKVGWTKTLSLARDTEVIGQPRQLVFENSLAGFDTVALFGKLSTKLSADRQPVQVYRSLTPGQPTASQELDFAGSPNVTGYALSTGYTSNQWLEYLAELLTPGRQVYELEHGQLRAVMLTTKELLTYVDEEGHTAAMLEYRRSARNSYFADYRRNTNRSAVIGQGW